ncbi:MAG: sulfotransferase [Porphyrobacter sp.]|nr:sulfotransferase [Porphyrobacter sp.]
MPDRDSTVLRLVDRLQPALQRYDRAKIRSIVEQLAALRAPMGDQWQPLAQLAASIGELGLFREALDLMVEALGGGPAAKYQKVALLAELGAWGEAYEVLCTLPDDVPDQAGNAYSRGTALLYLGRPDEAREHLERAARMQPQLGLPWFVLALSADLGRESDLAERIIAAEPGIANAIPSQRAPYYYALGKTHADRGEPERAFAAFARGARETKSFVAFDREADRTEAAEAVRDYSAERIVEIARRQHEPTERTLFVTGLPRSGTTLVEQILTAHSAVGEGAEANRLPLLAREIGGASYPALARYVEGHGPASAARLWHHWLDQLSPMRARVVDKTVTTSRFLGLAAALLPGAPLIWLTRDPLDRAWSCFRTNFMGAAMRWSYDLEDIAFHFRLEDELLARWQDVLGDRLLTVPYESLAGDPDQWIGRILAHCGLAEEPQVFAPHENRRPVATASMMQVRRPIDRGAIGSAEPYRPFLQPFIDAYYR